MEQNRRARNKSTQVQSFDFQQRCSKHTLQKKIASSANGAGKTSYLHAEE
jgi:hypothetical protein